VVERENMLEAWRRVRANKGAAGVDGITIDGMRDHVAANWPRIKDELLAGSYRPQAVRRVEIPKGTGGTRKLGIPTVMDRVIQQALHQVLCPIFDPTFSEHSYGFRPGRSAHQAIRRAKEYQLAGKRWVVDMDLAKFFDEVNHDLLMAAICRKVKDRKVLKLIRAYLRAGVMENGVVTANEKGTPQGGPLSPLLSNIMLDALDKELERRGHAFCRYADDCNIYVGSERSGKRVMEAVTRYVEGRLKLKVNREKSAVARPWHRKFLGYSFTSRRQPQIKAAAESVKKFRETIRERFRSTRGRNQRRFINEQLNPVIRGWINYFGLCETKGFAEELDGWVRRKLRVNLWRQWKRSWTRRKRLIETGLSEEHAVRSAFNRRGPWWNAGAKHMNIAFPKKYFDQMGLVSMVDKLCLGI